MRDYLTQVVLNLVLNAIDATEDQGKIHVEAHVEGDWLILSVEDDGRGISLADRCRLFQPFFTTKPHGTGLGLFVSRQILEDVAGQLGYRSELGQGSTFIVRPPAGAVGRRRHELSSRVQPVGADRASTALAATASERSRHPDEVAAAEKQSGAIQPRRIAGRRGAGS